MVLPVGLPLQQLAAAYVRNFDFPIPMLVDPVADGFEAVFAPWPFRCVAWHMVLSMPCLWPVHLVASSDDRSRRLRARHCSVACSVSSCCLVSAAPLQPFAWTLVQTRFYVISPTGVMLTIPEPKNCEVVSCVAYKVLASTTYSALRPGSRCLLRPPRRPSLIAVLYGRPARST
jgi:hypothetical protein